MELNLKKPLVFFDLETTGVNYSHDKIVELSYVKVMPNGKEMEDTMQMGVLQNILSEFFRKYQANNNRLDREDCIGFTLIGVNQLREKIGAYGD